MRSKKGLGVGWTMQAVNEGGAITKVLSRPWTTDGQTFRDRCWTNKQSLVNSVNTQLTQMIVRGRLRTGRFRRSPSSLKSPAPRRAAW